MTAPTGDMLMMIVKMIALIALAVIILILFDWVIGVQPAF
jgi:hypothetical protein